MKLRPKFIEIIYNELDRGAFCKEDFIVNFEDSNFLVHIAFRGHKDYRFYIHETYNRNGPLSTIHMFSPDAKKIIESYESPGEYNLTQTVTHKSFEDAIEKITDWTHRIREDLISTRRYSQPSEDEIISSFQKQIDESIESENDYFTDQEESDLSDN